MKVAIRARLTAAYCIVFFCSMVLLGIGSYWGISAAIYAIVDHDLRARLAGVEEFLDEHLGKRSLDRLQAEVRHHEALQPAHLSIAEAGGATIYLGEAFQGQDSQAAHVQPGLGVISVWTLSANPESMRMLATRFSLRGRDYDLVLATDLSVPLGIMREARLVLLLSALPILLCASLTGYWISGRALAPVSGLTRAARSIDADDLTKRIEVPDTGDELRDLALTLNQMLERIDNTFRQVAQFTANASHELRTPLALIRTTAEVALLRRSATAATYRDALHHVLSEAERNTALLDHLLFLARADAGYIPAKRPIEIGAEIERVCEQVQVLAFEKDLSVRVKTDGDPLWISGNAEHLRRLWLVLLDNAVKYTPAGGEIVISMRTTGSGQVSVEVLDTGIGVAATDLPHLFERFFRADEARTRGVGGTGLGLAIARWVADAHDATIDVRSAVGKGSVFRVTFVQTVAASIADAVPTGVTVSV